MRLLLRDTEAPRFSRSMAQHGKAVIVRVIDPPPEYRENASIPGHYGTWWHGWNLDMPEGRKAVVDNGLAPIRPGRVWIAETFFYSPPEFEMSLSTTHPVYPEVLAYKSDDPKFITGGWRSPAVMPRDLCRPEYRKLTATVRVCRAGDVTEQEAILWGAIPQPDDCDICNSGLCSVHLSPLSQLESELNITDPRAWCALAEIGAEG